MLLFLLVLLSTISFWNFIMQESQAQSSSPDTPGVDSQTAPSQSLPSFSLLLMSHFELPPPFTIDTPNHNPYARLQMVWIHPGVPTNQEPLLSSCGQFLVLTPKFLVLTPNLTR